VVSTPTIGTVLGIARANGGAVLKAYPDQVGNSPLFPWGQEPADTGFFIVRYRMGQQEYDGETALYHMGARYYDPQLGRWLSEDPAGIAGGLNLYAYAGNDPVNGRDPTGMHDCTGVEDPTGGHWECHNPCEDGYHIGSMEVSELDGGALGLSGRCVSNDGTGVDRPYWVVLDFQLAPVTIEGCQMCGAYTNPVDGFALNGVLATPFGGLAVSVGEYWVDGTDFTGGFLTLGQGQGVDLAAGFSRIQATNLNALGGQSTGGCGSVIVAYCRYVNQSGETVSGGASGGPLPWIAGGYGGPAVTFITKPSVITTCYASGLTGSATTSYSCLW